MGRGRRDNNKAERAFFHITPRIVLADSVTQVRISPLFANVTLPPEGQYQLEFRSREHACVKGDDTAQLQVPGVRDGKDLCVMLQFPGEGEHELRLRYFREDGTEYKCFTFRLYSLKEDYFALRPYKGDFHAHTCHSDGDGSPGYTVARYREMGMDFVAVTDHYRYAPSLEAMEEVSAFEVDFKIFPGEEVHAPDNPVHIVNFGGSFGVNEIWQKDEALYRKEVEALIPELPELEEELQFAVASSQWVFRKIQQGNGLAVFCHPYWECNGRFAIPENLTTAVWNHGEFDAVEIASGFWPFEYDTNMLQGARYREEEIRGNRHPVVGVSDAHGTDEGLAGWYYTVVLAPGDELKDLIGSIKSFRSVAVDAPAGERMQLYGDFRLVKFVAYLILEIFPLHDQLCQQEGALLLRAMKGDTLAENALKCLKGSVKNFYDAIYAKSEQ